MRRRERRGRGGGGGRGGEGRERGPTGKPCGGNGEHREP